MAALSELGGGKDVVKVRLGDQDILITESYEVKTSILQQPSAFSLRLGSNDLAIDILNLAIPGTPFELSINGRLLQTGIIDFRGVPSAKSTDVEIRGRDWLSVLVDSYVPEDQEFAQKSYYDLTRKVLDLAGLTEAKGHFLQILNDTNRRLLTGSSLVPREGTEVATELFTGALGGTGNLVFQTPKTKTGERYWDFLQRQYKLAGLFLWASPDKTIVLAAPNANQPPSYSLFRARARPGASENSNILDCSWRDDTTMRHSECRVFGRSGGGKKGIETCDGVFVDPDFEPLGQGQGLAPSTAFNPQYKLNKTIVIHDADVKNREQCEFVARRIISEERRAGWQLEYTVAGHTVFSESADNQTATWGPDTVVQVDDEELGMHGQFYLEACTYSRTPQTTTKLTLMRTTDLLFATGLAGEPGGVVQRKLKVPRGKTVK